MGKNDDTEIGSEKKQRGLQDRRTKEKEVQEKEHRKE